MSYGNAEKLSDPASVLDIKSPTDMAADGLANGVMVCWATSIEIKFTYTDVTGISSSGAVTSTSELVKPSVSTDKNGKWLLTWRDGMDIKVTASNDNGSNWSTAITISSSPSNLLQNISDPVIETSGNGLWKVVWGEATSSNWFVYGASSTDNGATWSAPILIKSHAITEGVLTGINYLDLAANWTDNWLIAWTLQERTFGSSTITDQTTLWSASCDGSGWTTAQSISQCPIINNPSLTNDEGQNWIVVWEEELPNNGALEHRIYQKNSSDGGVNWGDKQFITAGQSPYIAHSEASEYALAFVAAEERSNSGSDVDIIIRYTKDAGLNWSSPQLGNPNGKTDDGITDAHPILAKKTDSSWALAWNKNYAVSNEVHSEVMATTLDGSAPFGTVTSDAGPSTVKSTSLSFTRTDFEDDQSGFSHYQWALGTPENPEAYITFPTDPATAQTVAINKTILPIDIPADRAPFAAQQYFSAGEYVYTLRAYNDLHSESQNDTWLYREVEVYVEVIPVKIGGDIPLPEGKVWTDIDWANTKMRVGGQLNDAFTTPVTSTDRALNTHTILVESAQRFIAADHTYVDETTQVPLFIQWAYTAAAGGGTLNFEYAVVTEPDKRAMIMYHTNLPNSEEGTLAPLVDVSNIVPNFVIHYNQTIPSPITTINFDPNPFWKDSSDKLHARETASRDFPYIVLQYNNPDGSLIDFEIVLLKAFEPDVIAGVVDIGSRILPHDKDIDGHPKNTPLSTACNMGECPKIVNGLDKLYRHEVAGSDQNKQIWAIKQSTGNAGIAIFWQTEGLEQVVWPFEYRRYTVPDWPKNHPKKYQEYIRGTSSDNVADGGKTVMIPSGLTPQLMNPEPTMGHAHFSGNTFYTDAVDEGNESWTLLKYTTTDWVGFEVIKSIPRAPTSSTAIVGREITDTYHEGSIAGAYVYQPYGNKYAIDIQEETGQVFGVNTGNLEVWWSNLSRTTDPEGSTYPNWPTGNDFRIQWPSKVVQYEVEWGTETEEIIISTQTGTGAIPPDIYGTEWDLYYQNDPMLPGFNPNDEHALKIDNAIFPLRNDLGTASEPYVLMSYKDPNNNDLWAFEVFDVLKETAEFPFSDWASVGRPIDKYEGDAGKLIQAPFPLSLLPIAPKNEAVSGNYFEDKNGNHWAKAAGNDGISTEDIAMRYYYPIQPSFYLGDMFPGTSVGTQVPWLPSTGDNLTGIPVDITYTIHWPDLVPTMKIGQTILEAQYGIPAIDGQCSVDVVYEQSVENAGGQSVLLIDPIQTRFVDLSATNFPWGIATVNGDTELDLKDLNLALRRRISYDKTTEKLSLKGEKVSPVIGFDYAFLNVMSAREKEELLGLSTDGTWRTAVNALYDLTKVPIVINNSSTDPYDLLALTAGLAEGVGYVTLVMQNGDQCGAAPISLEIIKVIPELETSGLAVITPSCPFDETLTMRHKGDFGGASDGVEFEWQYIPDAGGVPPTDNDTWIPFPTTPATGLGAIDNTIAGPGLLTLSDNWVRCRYKTTSTIPALVDNGLPPAENPAWSDWTTSQFAPGWIKRVIGDVNPFTQRASGGGIEGAEGAFFDFGEQPVNTIVSMISQAGARWAGNTPLNCNNINDFGLIEIYETVLGRGVDLSIEGLPPVDYPPANNALLLAASRISDMYMLLGNEAYADAADPTIAFSTDDTAPGGYGTVASSIHSFQNQTASLMEEELALLRGRDNANAPDVGFHPVYNNLYWNFTNGDGEVAYNANYNIQDAQGDVNGTIDEADAKVFYPQGHGDAWGHYLMATKTYYKLLTHPNYTWIPRSEAVLLGGQAITVDYFDERHFAKAAAAKAQAGAEIVDLTYRSVYVEDPEGQYKGYKDEDTERAWGFNEWADRAGQGAYIDWVVGNSILPSVDEEHTGIQKIDRTTVLELRDVAVKALDIQKQVDEANTGLNPLGLATNVVPFDISPAEIDAGKTHFEQVYDRAIIGQVYRQS